MTKLTSFYYSILILHVALILAAMVHAHDDQSGFISIDCGIPGGSKYTDKTTVINYVSDAGFIEGGVNHEILPAYNYETLDLQLTTLKSFPQNTRNCYTLRPKQGKNNKYLIRVRYLQGNYDSQGQAPEFDLYLGPDLWNKDYLPDPSWLYYNEIIHLATSDFIHICLVNIGKGVPFVSAIELRLLVIAMYEPQSTSLYTSFRYNLGSNEDVRYEDDKYDRIWYSSSWEGYRVVQTSDIISSSGSIKVPSKVMSTAITPTISTDSISYTWNASSIKSQYVIYMHFAEVETLRPNQTREINIYLNSKKLNGIPITPLSTNTTTIISPPVTSFSSYTLEIRKTPNSTLPPIINAIEIFIIKQFQQQQTLDEDVAALWSIKSSYGLKRNNWQGDPCVPQTYVWDGLNCSYNDPQLARIISLNLSSSGLSGEIATALANLTKIQSLDLSYNNLTGRVPEFLAQQDNLMTLDLRGNNFTRPIPTELLSKSKKGLSLRIDQGISDQVESSSCPNASCKKKNNKLVVISVISVTAFVMVLSAIVWITLKRRKTKRLVGGPPPTANMNNVMNADLSRREEPFPSRHKQFTYSEVEDITNNFTDVIGRGGFGAVYRGCIGDNQIAVKMLSKSSKQGDKQFHAEVMLLMDVRHKNITSFIGYCNDRGEKGIIYEFMANGNLEKHLFFIYSPNTSPNVLSWESRLQIACDAAEGLEYMHHGCSPPIVHRDIKSSNILLNKSFQAKLGDLGLSRAFATEDATHVTTLVAGTRGYLDPEYLTNGWLTEKSDVYSFGVVLLELITGRRALSGDTNIIDRVKSIVEKGSVEKTIDPRLEGVFNINTAWKVVELALACVSPISNDRPNMNDVARDLKQCLQEVKTRHETKSNNQIEIASVNMEGVSDPSPR